MTALAIFVKTPGRSPIKTRLAAGIGPDSAAAFYTRAVQAVREVAASTPALTPYWAVAEAEIDPMWNDFATISQGDGDLGDRLDHIYRTLLARHGHVLLIGADTPQITPALLAQARDAATPFAMGRAEDGGFWLFGGRQPIPVETWRAVPYSTEHTAERLRALIGETTPLEELRDVDHAEDLPELYYALLQLETLTPGQAALRDWLAEAP